jgi:hypothetical protein
MAEMIKIGRFANIPLVPLPIKIPVVTFGRNGRLALESLGVFNPTSDPDPRNPPPRGPNRPPNNRVQQAEVVLQLVSGRNEWFDAVITRPWWLAMQICFCGGFLLLLVLITFKFIKKINREDRRRNISLACLVFHAALCILLLVRWIDPLETRGLFARESDLMFILLPSSLSYIGFSLMAFYWFKSVLPFDGSKTTLFFTSKGFRVSYWLVAGAVFVLTLIALIVDRVQLTLSLVFAVEIVQLVANLIVAAMYIIITVRWKLTQKKEQMHLDNKAQFLNVFSRKIFAALAISSVVMTIEPIARFVLMRYVVMNEYLHIAVLMTESFLLAVLVLFQVLFMPDDSFMNKKSEEDPTKAHDMNSMSAGTNSEKDDENSSRSSQEQV